MPKKQVEYDDIIQFKCSKEMKRKIGIIAGGQRKVPKYLREFCAARIELEDPKYEKFKDKKFPTTTKVTAQKPSVAKCLKNRINELVKSARQSESLLLSRQLKSLEEPKHRELE